MFRSDGTLFAASLMAQLYTVNTTTGQSSYIGYTLYGSAGDLEFDPDGKLIMAALGVNLVELATTADGSGSVFQSLIAAATPYSFFGLAIGTQGILYGVAGTEIVSIDRTTWQVVTIVNHAGQGLGAAYGASRR